MRNLIPHKLSTILLLVCATLFVFHGAIFAQVTGKIAGKVTDAETGERSGGCDYRTRRTHR